jgi:hypothetical protein
MTPQKNGTTGCYANDRGDSCLPPDGTRAGPRSRRGTWAAPRDPRRPGPCAAPARTALSGEVTRLGADAAVFLVLSVRLALLAASAAGLGAGLDDGSGEGGLERGLSAEHVSGRRADVGAVEVQADAAHERRQLLLSEAGVRACAAALGAVVTGIDTTAEDVDPEGAASAGVPRSFAGRGSWSLLSMGERARPQRPRERSGLPILDCRAPDRPASRRAQHHLNSQSLQGFRRELRVRLRAPHHKRHGGSPKG